jgi:predicted lipid-binding transport protein (Tim44 family)
MRRVLPLALAWVLAGAATALGAAGGGSSGFGGGGGGGGEFDPWSLLFVVIVFAIILLISHVHSRRKRRRQAGTWDPSVAADRDRETHEVRTERTRKVAGKALVAAEDDPAFAPEVVAREGERLFREIQAAWDRRDDAALRRMVAPELMVEWLRRLADFHAKGWHNRVIVHEPVVVEYVGLTNREGHEEDRVVVRVSATIEDFVQEADGDVLHHTGMDQTTTAIREFWTLGRHGDGWMLLSIEQDHEGEHQLRAPIVADPADDGRMVDEALVEGGVERRLPAGHRIADLADLDFDGDALTAARDLSLADGRFDPGVIEAGVRRAVAAWAEAVDGEDDPLLAVAAPEVVLDMLHPGDRSASTRLVVRGPRVGAIRVSEVDAATEPPRVRVEVDVEGVRFVEDRDTLALLAGSRTEAARFTEHWTLALDDASPDTPWRLVGGAPVSLA